MTTDDHGSSKKKGRLRWGFSTGTAATAAARAALRCLVSGSAPKAVAVRLPSAIHLGVSISWAYTEEKSASAAVIKDGGDDPDITSGAEIVARVHISKRCDKGLGSAGEGNGGVLLSAGKGVGVVTKAGLPVAPGEPAINPVPRQMLLDNLRRELHDLDLAGWVFNDCKAGAGTAESIFLPFEKSDIVGSVSNPDVSTVRPDLAALCIEVEIAAPKGEELARHTLNPRLGIVGGISILGTTGLVKPFSHQAYRETIQAALSVAASNGCKTAILSTGGKSERFAKDVCPLEPGEAFIQIADFFAFAVEEAHRFKFTGVVHSVFFGKAVKMAQGHAYTHAHSVPMELQLLADIAERSGYDAKFCRELVMANTARHALEIIVRRGAGEIISAVAEKACAESLRLAGGMDVRLLLFDYNGSLLADVK